MGLLTGYNGVKNGILYEWSKIMTFSIGCMGLIIFIFILQFNRWCSTANCSHYITIIWLCFKSWIVFHHVERLHWIINNMQMQTSFPVNSPDMLRVLMWNFIQDITDCSILAFSGFFKVLLFKTYYIQLLDIMHHNVLLSSIDVNGRVIWTLMWFILGNFCKYPKRVGCCSTFYYHYYLAISL